MLFIDPSGVEVAKVNEVGSYAKRHEGVTLKKPGDLPPKVRNRVGRIAKKIGKASIIGIGIGLFFFGEEVKAHGIEGAAARNVPILGSFVEFDDDLEGEVGEFYQKLNAPVRRSHERAKEMTVKWLEYEMENRVTTGVIDEKALIRAVTEFHNELQGKYHIEISTGKAANINEIGLRFQSDVQNAIISLSGVKGPGAGGTPPGGRR